MEPENNSIQAITRYITECLDPHAILRRTDDPAQTVADLDSIFADDGGCGITVEQMAKYLTTLPE